MNEEDLKQENERLKTTIKDLRRQLEYYRKNSKRRYQLELDFVPYHEEERD